MKVSGFTFVRNATDLYYPIIPCITSILPIVDEFVVILGEGSETDQTLLDIQSIGSDKIKIINSIWDTNTFQEGTVYAQQTDLAKSNCTGDWLFYIQSDEVVHEKDLPILKQAMEFYHQNDQIDGLLFDYKHFWGDYDHYHDAHQWYDREIRIIKNNPKIHSWRDAQSFRIFNNPFVPSTASYLQKAGTQKLKVAETGAEIFHYGYVRPPAIAFRKERGIMQRVYNKAGEEVEKKVSETSPNDLFNYGPLGRLPRFKGSHPKVMKEWIKKFNWSHELDYSTTLTDLDYIHKHNWLSQRILSWIENNLLFGRRLGSFKNYLIVDRFKPGSQRKN